MWQISLYLLVLNRRILKGNFIKQTEKNVSICKLIVIFCHHLVLALFYGGIWSGWKIRNELLYLGIWGLREISFLVKVDFTSFLLLLLFPFLFTWLRSDETEFCG